MKRKVFYKKIHWENPKDFFLRIYSRENSVFWLDSSRAEEGVSRFSYMGKAAKIYSYSHKSKKEDIFSYLKKQLQEKYIQSDLPCDFIGGYVGYFDYELENCMWFFVDKFLVFDHERKVIYLVCVTNDEQKAKEWFSNQEEKINKNDFLSKQTNTSHSKTVTFKLARSHAQYLKDIATCKQHLKNGESYQICLTNTITTTLAVSDVALYYMLRELNPAPFAAFIKHGDFSILSSSPERFLSIDTKRNVEAKPIKGTIRRSKNKKEDVELAKKLLRSEKDRAENLMITDLLRNDLGKVCDIGSISVPHFIALETYRTVHQLVSTIRGKLRNNVSSVDCIRACFPGGSMTGVPKKRTMEILASLEKKPRGVYSGALGYLSLNGAIDTSIVIRTIVKNKNTLSIGAGGAILMESKPEKEYQEMILKAEILLQTIVKTIGAKNYILKGA